ncbi:hypothetical protein LUZ62_084482 [Rhynchospora pubera]|uniref:4Fe-4S ferredoxin-type domain-containing protein n=1 Tax=Rhynchospora pubera TaxID=906938 RepID=A0AAV8C6D9_9POAL|nr:hypothetical protein LUZ62_084482 [Rhynchospora pubera]
MPPLRSHSHSLPSSNKASLLSTVKTLARSTNARSTKSLHAPIESLRRGDWVKLICGASFEDVADVRNLSLVYTLAGVDCIDCAADASVVNAVNEGINMALSISAVNRPWVMISVNDDRQDLHFRKAEFDPEDCPTDCPRPCEAICPADAISLKLISEINGTGSSTTYSKLEGGVITERCYGCGRCFSVCPFDKIRAMTYVRDPITTCNLLERDDVDALEIHTNGRGTNLFSELWDSLGDSISHTKLTAVSLPYIGEASVGVMNQIFSIMQSCPPLYNLWQLDGRPMSGDIGRGATKQTISYAIHLASTQNRPHGFYQLAGGTNLHTVECLKKERLFRTKTGIGQDVLIGGIAYGGYARKIVGKVLRKVPTENGYGRIEDHPEHLLEALEAALALLGPVKSLQSHST